jgi:hypothetical protein
MIDIAILAGTVVAKYLVPVFSAGWDAVFDAAKEEVGDKVADETKGIVSSLWSRLRASLTSDEQKAALATFEKRPAATAPLLEDLLREKLEQDSTLADQLDALVNRRPGDGALSGAQIIGSTVNNVTVHGGVKGHAIVAGQYNAAPAAPAAPFPPASAGTEIEGSAGT